MRLQTVIHRDVTTFLGVIVEGFVAIGVHVAVDRVLPTAEANRAIMRRLRS
jgi:hypothetical protein